MKDHILSRLINQQYDGDEEDFTDADRLSVRILNNRIYSCQVLRINYTTYDCRRDQDTMNPRTNCDVMVHSRELGPHAQPFWYARILGIFFAEIVHVGAASRNLGKQRMEFLWVRWFGTEPGHRWGFKAARLPKIGFIPDTDMNAFGFLDPSLVLRGCQLIPSFVDGRTSGLLNTTSRTAARRPEDVDDWTNFYVNMYVGCLYISHVHELTCISFADRDMVMRFLGGAVGHVNANKNDLQADEEWNDDEMDVDDSANPSHQQYENIDDDEAEALERQRDAGGCSEDDEDSVSEGTQSSDGAQGSSEEESNYDDTEDEGDSDADASL